MQKEVGKAISFCINKCARTQTSSPGQEVYLILILTQVLSVSFPCRMASDLIVFRNWLVLKE